MNKSNSTSLTSFLIFTIIVAIFTPNCSRQSSQIIGPEVCSDPADCDGGDEEDSDGDGVIDSEDNCKDLSNSSQSDDDADGVGNECDSEDTDGDGLINSEDNCYSISNSDQVDIDSDGVGDGCDNCKDLSNSSQSDDDADGVGNECDSEDTDGDGLINSEDNCYNISNSDQVDIDSDGVGDACDNCKDVSNSDQFDDDANGVGNECEEGDDDNDGIKIDVFNPSALVCLFSSCNENKGSFSEDYSYSFGSSWGSTSHYVTDIDINGSNVLVSRYAHTGNSTAWLLEESLSELRDWEVYEEDNVTGVAFCDVDGDGKDEVALAIGDSKYNEMTYTLPGFSLLTIYDDDHTTILYDYLFYGVNGDSCDDCDDLDNNDAATGVDCGDIDGDGRDEVVVATSSQNNAEPRGYIVELDEDGDYTANGFGKNTTISADSYSNSVAVGDIDGDGKAEIVIGLQNTEYDTYHSEPEYAEYVVYDDKNNNYSVLKRGLVSGEPTKVAMGDVDGDGLMEIGIATDKDSAGEYRYYVLDDANNSYNTLFAGGDDLDDDIYATDISMADIDGDDRSEVAVSIYVNKTAATSHPLGYIFNDAKKDFEEIATFGEDFLAWGSSVAIGDLDVDGYGELILGVGGLPQDYDRVYMYNYNGD